MKEGRWHGLVEEEISLELDFRIFGFMFSIKWFD